MKMKKKSTIDKILNEIMSMVTGFDEYLFAYSPTLLCSSLFHKKIESEEELEKIVEEESEKLGISVNVYLTDSGKKHYLSYTLDGDQVSFNLSKGFFATKATVKAALYGIYTGYREKASQASFSWGGLWAIPFLMDVDEFWEKAEAESGKTPGKIIKSLIWETQKLRAYNFFIEEPRGIVYALTGIRL